MQKKLNFRDLAVFGLVIALLLGGFVISRLFKEAAPFHRSEYLMGTIFDITVHGGDADILEEVSGRAFDEIRRIEDLMSRQKEGSEVSLINRHAGIEPVIVSEELINLLKEAVTVSEISGGAFDVTIGPLASLWGFDEEKKIVPSGEEIEGLRSLVDYRKMRIDEVPSTVYLEEKGMMIDVGGIAKGYALARAMKVFKESGIYNVIINAGGNLNLRGYKGKNPWRIGIQDPRDEKKLLGVLNITDTSVSTSGDYQRYFIRDGARYHHILDPKTGYPARDVISVTIVGKNEAETDALSTAVFVLGVEKGLELIKKTGTEGVMITKEGEIIVTEGLRAAFKISP